MTLESSRLRAPGLLFTLDAVGKAAQRICDAAHGRNRLPPHLRNDFIVYIPNCLANFRFDRFDGFFKPARGASRFPG
jgi:hypothetical protein